MIPGRNFHQLRLAEAFAEALVRVGDRDRAIEVLQTATSDRRAVLAPQQAQHWVWARNAYAELLRRLGRDAEAELVERDLLSMLSEADADHVREAAREARGLGAASDALTRLASPEVMSRGHRALSTDSGVARG